MKISTAIIKKYNFTNLSKKNQKGYLLKVKQ